MMSDKSKLQCEYKLVDAFVSNGISVRVFVYTRKQAKQYCRDTLLDFEDGLKNFYDYG